MDQDIESQDKESIGEVIKEPRGFIRCLEWIISLTIFITVSNYLPQMTREVEKFNKDQDMVRLNNDYKSDAWFIILMSAACLLYSSVR